MLSIEAKEGPKLRTGLLVLSLTLPLLSCKNSEENKTVWVKPESTTVSCEEYDTVKTEQGIVTNNVWNKFAAKDDPWSQCLEKRLVGGEIQFGWSWSWPFGRRVIYSQPQIKIGASPWAPEPKFDSSFPLKISDLKNLDISHELDIQTNGEHNTATTMWLIKEPYKGSKPKPSIIEAEIMIWTYATEKHFNPAGRMHSELKVNDIVWEVWYEKNWEDKSGVNDNKWRIISFRASKSSMKADIPGLALLNYAIDEKLISENLYVADVELGNEIMSGSGIAWVNKFDVVYEKQ